MLTMPQEPWMYRWSSAYKQTSAAEADPLGFEMRHS